MTKMLQDSPGRPTARVSRLPTYMSMLSPAAAGAVDIPVTRCIFAKRRSQDTNSRHSSPKRSSKRKSGPAIMSASGKNPFFDDDDDDVDKVDDNEFLRHPKAGNKGYMLPQHNHAQLDPIEARRQTILEKCKKIEQRTVDSSSRSLGLLYESEKVGIATSEELGRQKEQLKATEVRLDDINATLQQSERHLTGIKSFFGGLKNYFSGRGAAAPPPQAAATSVASNARIPPSSSATLPRDSRQQPHPALRSGGTLSLALECPTNADAIINANLDEMSLGLGRLQVLARNMGQELEEHDDIIGRLDHKTSSMQWRVEKQNKEMRKILGKK